MAIRELRQHPSRKFGSPDRADLLPVIGVIPVMVLLVVALDWISEHGGFSSLGVIGGVTLGVVMVVAWSLRDGLLQGEPRFKLSRRISLSSLIIGVILAASLWTAGPEAGWTSMLT